MYADKTVSGSLFNRTYIFLYK